MHKHLPTKAGKNIITNLAGVLLLFIASLHLLRTLKGWEATVGDWVVPMWVSGAAFVLAIYVAVLMFRMDK